MPTEHGGPFSEQGRRLRLLRQAERRGSGAAFAKWLGWGQSNYAQFEAGSRMVPADKAIQLARSIPGFDPMWLWEDKREGLGFDLRRRIEEEEAKEMASRSTRSERQDV
jgi:hypothetical protein